jgi:hypothetical protein
MPSEAGGIEACHRPPKHAVNQLRAATDPQNRYVQAAGPFYEKRFGGVSLRIDWRARRTGRPPRLGRQILASDKHQSVQTV